MSNEPNEAENPTEKGFLLRYNNPRITIQQIADFYGVKKYRIERWAKKNGVSRGKQRFVDPIFK